MSLITIIDFMTKALQNPTIRLVDGSPFIELAFLSKIFPEVFPKGLLDQSERRKVFVFLTNFLKGSGLEMNDAVYKPLGIRKDGVKNALLRLDYFQLIVMTAPGTFLPWSSKRKHYISTFAKLPVSELLAISSVPE